MTILVKTLVCEKGEIFAIMESRRVLLAHCRINVEIFENSQSVSVLGAQGYKVKTHYSMSLCCESPEATCDVDVDYLRSVDRFEVVADIQRLDGIFERVQFDSLIPANIDLHGDWTFDYIGSYEHVKKLLVF